jgi:hypothetical protein
MGGRPVNGIILKLMVLGSIRKQAEQTTRSKPVSSTLSCPLYQLLPSVLGLARVPVLASLRICKLNKLSFPSCFWSWCFVTAILTLSKTVDNCKHGRQIVHSWDTLQRGRWDNSRTEARYWLRSVLHTSPVCYTLLAYHTQKIQRPIFCHPPQLHNSEGKLSAYNLALPCFYFTNFTTVYLCLSCTSTDFALSPCGAQ